VGCVGAGSFCRFRSWREVEDDFHVRKEKRTTWAACVCFFFLPGREIGPGCGDWVRSVGLALFFF
jgi:hypothetical protein